MESFGILVPLMGIGVGMLAVAGWIFTTWLRVKHGYPLDGPKGPIHPRVNEETQERVRLLTSENSQLRAELGAIKDRLATVERIVTDDGARVAAEIDRLRAPRN